MVLGQSEHLLDPCIVRASAIAYHSGDWKIEPQEDLVTKVVQAKQTIYSLVANIPVKLKMFSSYLLGAEYVILPIEPG